MAGDGEKAEPAFSGGERRRRKANLTSDPSAGMVHRLPSTVMATILSKLDLRSLCAVSASCRSFRSCATHTLSFIPSFHLLEIALTLDLLRPLLPPNPCLRSLKLDCSRLDDSSIVYLARTSLQELWLHNCENFSGMLLSELGRKCPDLRSIYLSSLGGLRRLSFMCSGLKELLTSCSRLESLSLLSDVAGFNHPEFAQLWAAASDKLTSLEIGYIPMAMFTALLDLAVETQLLSRDVRPPLFPNLQKLCLSVDYISDHLIRSLSSGLPSLTHLDLQDAPIVEPILSSDLTNLGLQHINRHGMLKHISLIRCQKYLFTYFLLVNDLGMLLMSDTCTALETITLGGFCRVTDTGFRAIIHSCSNLRKLSVYHGSQLTDLVFHDISATSLSLTHVSLRWCNLLTSIGIARLSFNKELTVIDLRDCRCLGDEALKALQHLRKLHTLLLDRTDLSDTGLRFLSRGTYPLASLSLRGCRRLTNACIVSLFGSSVGQGIRVLDLSGIPNLSDDGILALAKARIPITELRVRECPQIGDTAIMALASMQVAGGSFGSSMHLLDVYDCHNITPLSIRWFKKPYFPRLRWLGLTGRLLNLVTVDCLVRSRPFLHVAFCGEEHGMGFWDSSFGLYHRDEYELDELEQWLLEEEDGNEYHGDDEDDVMMELLGN